MGIGPYGSVTRGAAKRAVGDAGPYGRLQVVRCEEESPSHGFAVPALFRQGSRGDEDADCHDQFANWSRNDMVYYGRKPPLMR